MNVPNKLTVSRLFLTVAFLICFFAEFPLSNTAALFLFVLAAITDYWDGKIARQEKIVTNFGVLMDPLADKILICSAFIGLVGIGLVASWMAIIIVVRELAITGLRLLAASSQIILPAEKSGKIKTTFQLTALISTLVMISYPEWGTWAEILFGLWLQPFVRITLWIAVLLTLGSGVSYLWKNRNLFMKDL
jgi:CDP-diacylglycerol--glycerol-3-phosphate 3-phosphatidyltransferase